jgi:hypothetical protein
MSRVTCDVVVVGSELCGLAAAALIAQQASGKRVIVLDDGDPSLALALGDRFVPTAPGLVRLGVTTAGLDRATQIPSTPNAQNPIVQSPVAQLLDSLGAKQDVRRVLGDVGGLGIIDDPDIRMIVPIEAEARVRELARVFGPDEGARTAVKIQELSADARAALYAEAALLHEDGFFEKRRARKRVEALGPAGSLDEEDPAAVGIAGLSLGVAAGQLLPFLQWRSVGDEGAAASARGLAGLLAGLQMQAGVHGASRGGLGPRAALAELLADVIRRHRGEVLKGKVEALEVDGKNVTVVKATGANDYVARVVIDATSRRDLATRLPEGRRKEKLLESEKHVQLAGDAAVVRWLVPAASLPRGLAPVSLVLAPPTEAGGGILVGVYSGAPLREGHKNVGVDDTLVAVVAATTCAAGKAAAAAAEVEAALERLLPFAKEQLKARDALVGGPARTALPRWAVVESEHPLMGRRPQTPFANLLRAGRDLVPGLGVEGELMAARSVVTVAEHLLGAGRRSDAA